MKETPPALYGAKSEAEVALFSLGRVPDIMGQVLHFDTALNLLWALFCVGAVVYNVRSERRCRGGSRQARAFRAVALFLAVVAIFPCVSASDDTVRFQYLDATQNTPDRHHPGQTQPAPAKSLAILVRLLESLESVQIPVIVVLCITLLFFTLVLVERRKSQDRLLPKRSGRAPPCLPSLA